MDEIGVTQDEFLSALANMPQPQPLSYRLYHDHTGRVLFYSMEDLSGTYIEIDQDTFNRGATNIRVRDGQIVEVAWTTTEKIQPSESGTLCHAHDVSVVVTDSGQYWSKQTYEQS